MWKRIAVGIFVTSLIVFSVMKWAVYSSYSLTYTKIPAPSLATSLYDNQQLQDGFVMLPPGYHKSSTNYPVVYYLHGFGGDASTAEMIARKIRTIQLLTLRPQKKFILIGFNGRHKHGGSFYVNSPITGNWEDFVVEDVKEFAETNFRIKKDRDCSMLFGFSMGGFGAINLGLKYPGKYKHVFALSPGLFGEKTLFEAVDHWHQDQLFSLEQSYAAAFAYKEDLTEQSPWFSFDGNDSNVVMRWENGMGNLEDKLNRYLSLDEQLSSIRLEYGSKDYYWWIKDGAQHFSELLNKNNIDHEIHDHKGGHKQDLKQIKHLIKFINKNICK